MAFHSFVHFLNYILLTAAQFQAPLLSTVPSPPQWTFNFSSPAPHYFSSIHSLLKQWPQTFFPNGHSIAAGQIPAFTKLYHGRQDDEPPPSPEWLAFDIEMSYGIMGSTRSSYMLTYTTTRPVRVLYFDGESATLMGAGRMDTQMLAIFGNVTGPEGDNPGGSRGLWDEYIRANGLCDWLAEKGLRGRGWGFEGVVRMNAGFEVIWCDFNSPSLKLVSWMNVSAPLLGTVGGDSDHFDVEDEEVTPHWLKNADLFGSRTSPSSYYPLPPSPTRSDRATDPPNPAKPPNWRRRDKEPFLRSQGWGWFRSAAQHYAGERRVNLHQCGILNYHSPEFHSQAIARSLLEQQILNLTDKGLWNGPGRDGTREKALEELLRRRRSHRLDAVSVSDAAVMQDSTAALCRDIVTGNVSCSGMDWMTISSEIVNTYASPLLALSLLLQSMDRVPENNHTAVEGWLSQARDSTHALLVLFLEYPSNGTTPGVWSPKSQLYAETFARCRFHHTRLLENVTLNKQESLLKWSVEETMSSICSTIINVGFAIEEIWASDFNVPKTATDAEQRWDLAGNSEVLRWIYGIQELMAWLGWADQWIRCEHVCKWDETCYIPMWPMIHNDRRIGPPPRDPPKEGDGRRPGGPGRRPPNGGDGKRPPGGPGWWFPDETDLWNPRCVNWEYVMG